MTTPQEIREKSFDKARSMFGGYDMATIDEYLEELANDFEALQKAVSYTHLTLPTILRV